MRFIFALSIFAAISGQLAWAQGTPDARLGRVSRPLPDNKFFSCTATLISGRLVLTASHCVGPGIEFTWLPRSVAGKKSDNGVSGVQAVCSGGLDPKRPDFYREIYKDWAVLLLKEDFTEKLENFEAISVSAEIPSARDSLVLHAYEIERDGMINPFTIQDVNGSCRKSDRIPSEYAKPEPGRQYFLHSCRAGLGASGAPIFNEKNELVGLNVAQKRPENLNVATSTTNFHEVLEDLIDAEDDGELTEFIQSNPKICKSLN